MSGGEESQPPLPQTAFSASIPAIEKRDTVGEGVVREEGRSGRSQPPGPHCHGCA